MVIFPLTSASKKTRNLFKRNVFGKKYNSDYINGCRFGWRAERFSQLNKTILACAFHSALVRIRLQHAFELLRIDGPQVPSSRRDTMYSGGFKSSTPGAQK